MKIASIVGARPQFIKSAPVFAEVREGGHEHILIHTGQHYDHDMSAVFFQELNIPEPDVNLDVGSGSHGWQTGKMMMEIEKVLLVMRPDLVLVYGDTNSTLAGAIASCKLHIPLAHIEAGLRSNNRKMPEEHNRILTDHCSDLLFCPTSIAVSNLAQEGILEGVYLVGDTMKDAILTYLSFGESNSTILLDLDLKEGNYFLATVHRPANVDKPDNLTKIFSALNKLDHEVVLPLHPRTREQILTSDKLDSYAQEFNNIRFIQPVGYMDMLMLEKNARFIMTDSGGIQKEAFILAVPCITFREETEWVETLEDGWNVLFDYHHDDLSETVAAFQYPKNHPKLFGDGAAAKKIVDHLVAYVFSKV